MELDSISLYAIVLHLNARSLWTESPVPVRLVQNADCLPIFGGESRRRKNLLGACGIPPSPVQNNYAAESATALTPRQMHAMWKEHPSYFVGLVSLLDISWFWRFSWSMYVKPEKGLPTATASTSTTLSPLGIKAFLYDETWRGHDHARGIPRLASRFCRG